MPIRMELPEWGTSCSSNSRAGARSCGRLDSISVMAWASARLGNPLANGTSIFTNLEPCFNCSRLIHAVGIKTVAYSAHETNPTIDGEGKRVLEAHGVRIIPGILSERGARQTRLALFLIRNLHFPFESLRTIHKMSRYFLWN